MNPASPSPQVNPLFYVEGGPRLDLHGLPPHAAFWALLAVLCLFAALVLARTARARRRVRNLEAGASRRLGRRRWHREHPLCDARYPGAGGGAPADG